MLLANFSTPTTWITNRSSQTVLHFIPKAKRTRELSTVRDILLQTPNTVRYSLYGLTGDYYFVETGNLLLKEHLIVCPTLTASKPLVGINLAYSGRTLSTHLVLVLLCILFTTALLTL